MQQIENMNAQSQFRAELAAILRCVSRGRSLKGAREGRESRSLSMPASSLNASEDSKALV
jgi:hypothetical protein